MALAVAFATCWQSLLVLTRCARGRSQKWPWKSVFKLVIQYHLHIFTSFTIHPIHPVHTYIYIYTYIWIWSNLQQRTDTLKMNLPETWLSSFKVWNLKNQQSLFSKAIHAANGIPPSQQRALCLKVWGWGASKTCQLRSVVGVQTIGKCNLIAEMAFKKTTFPQPCERNTMKGN